MKDDLKPQMNADKHGFKHGEITQKIIGGFFEVYNELGHGFWNPGTRNPWRLL